jgi:hypothetical protein
MKNRSRFITSMAVLFVLIVVSILLYAVRRPNAAQTSAFSRLTLKMASTKEDFVELEPIPIILNLRNDTNQTILGHSALNFSNNFVKLFIVQENGQTQEIQNLTPVTANTAASPKKIEPGENLEEKQVLAFHLDKTFPVPGDYRIQAVLYDPEWTREVKSNVLTIRIFQPEGLDLEALKYIKSLAASSYFFSGVGFASTEKARSVLEEFNARFGETVYGDYANFLLGEHYFYDKKYKRASTHFSLLADKTSFVFADKAKKYLEKIKREGTASETP